MFTPMVVNPHFIPFIKEFMVSPYKRANKAGFFVKTQLLPFFLFLMNKRCVHIIQPE